VGLAGVGPTVCKMRQLAYSAEPEHTEIHIRVSKATTPSQDFTLKDPFIDILYCTYFTYKWCEYIFSLQGKNKMMLRNYDDCAFILAPVSMMCSAKM
jgi:hypothetical protein